MLIVCIIVHNNTVKEAGESKEKEGQQEILNQKSGLSRQSS